MLIDLSHRLEPGMPTYPGLPAPQFRTWMSHDESRYRGTYAPGTTFQIATYTLGGNTGTYIDAPFHRHPQGLDLAALALERTANLAGVTVAALHQEPIRPEQFEGLDLSNKAVLLRTDWALRWGGPEYFHSGPYLTDEASRLLVRSQAALVGIDCANIDNMNDPSRPAHTILLAAGIPIVEHLRNLDQLPPAGFRFFAVPPAIVSGTSFPVRAFAVLDS